MAYTRRATGEWVRDEIEGDGEIAIPFRDLWITTAEVYEGVQLPPLTVKEEWGAEDWLDAEAQ